MPSARIDSTCSWKGRCWSRSRASRGSSGSFWCAGPIAPTCGRPAAGLGLIVNVQRSGSEGRHPSGVDRPPRLGSRAPNQASNMTARRSERTKSDRRTLRTHGDSFFVGVRGPKPLGVCRPHVGNVGTRMASTDAKRSFGCRVSDSFEGRPSGRSASVRQHPALKQELVLAQTTANSRDLAVTIGHDEHRIPSGPPVIVEEMDIAILDIVGSCLRHAS